MRSTAVSQPSGELMTAWCCSASVLPVRVSPHPSHCLCAHFYTELSNSNVPHRQWAACEWQLADVQCQPVSSESLASLCQSQVLQFTQILSTFSQCLISQLTFRKRSHSCIFYLTRLTNMFCSREDIDLVHHTQIQLFAFLVLSNPSLFSLCLFLLFPFLLKPKTLSRFMFKFRIKAVFTQSKDTAQ